MRNDGEMGQDLGPESLGAPGRPGKGLGARMPEGLICSEWTLRQGKAEEQNPRFCFSGRRGSPIKGRAQGPTSQLVEGGGRQTRVGIWECAKGGCLRRAGKTRRRAEERERGGAQRWGAEVLQSSWQ